jgi:hypothetical protein
LAGDEDGRTRVKLEDRLHAVWQMRCARVQARTSVRKASSVGMARFRKGWLAQDGGAILREA